jgi:cytosine/adenosine deaminase-related metal-dependent hydrolase
MHPDTAAALGWKRSFDVSGAHFDLLTHDRSLQEIKHAFEEQGFNVAALYQPTFGAPEIPVFVRGGKEESYTDTAGHPAIYILHLRAADTAMKSDFRLAHARIVLGKQEIDSGDISVVNRRIASFISGGRKPSTEVSVDLSGYTLFPGLINAHDHLEFGLFPRLGRPPYKNATEWACDIQEKYAQTIQVHTAIPRDVRLWWGALRNLLCGVTTVCHHNPPSPMLEAPEFPLHVVTKFDWAHSLAFSDDLQERHRKSAHPHPFVLHACEGIDEEARAEFARLLEMKVVDERTVLVHGLAMTSQEISELNGCGASLIICPSSNDFLFGRAPARDQLLNVKRLAIGSDSPLTARGDLLDEISFCCETLQICPEAIFDLVTSAPASILGLSDHAGSIAPDASADLFAVRSSVLPPARQLTCLRWHDVEFVMTGGVVRLASEQIVDRLPALLRSSLEPLSIDGVIRWIAAPVSSIFQAAADVLGTENVSLDGRRILLPAKPHAV